MENRTCIVLLVSEQTLPNVMFLKWYLNRTDEEKIALQFITTEQMEKTGQITHIINSIEKKLLEKTEKTLPIIVDGYNIDDITEKMTAFVDDCKMKYENVIANITGGTKLMSLSVYEAVRNFEKSKIFYQPIEKNLVCIYPKNENGQSVKYESSEIITLEDYFKAYGIEFEYNNTCVKPWKYNQTVCEFIFSKYQNQRKLLQEFGDKDAWFRGISKNKKTFNILDLDIKKFDITQNEKNSIIKFVKEFKFNPEKLKYKEYFYMIGGWFEEYVYQSLLNDDYFSYLENPSEKIARNVKISKNGTKNELDVVYIDTNNKLNVIECKSFINDKSDLLIETIYKIQAIKSNFGISVQSSLYTASKIKNKTNIDRAENFKIKVKDNFLGL